MPSGFKTACAAPSRCGKPPNTGRTGPRARCAPRNTRNVPTFGRDASKLKQTRKLDKQTAEGELFARLWSKVETGEGFASKKDGSASTVMERALYVANYSRVSQCFPLADFPRDPPASQYEGVTSLWSALTDGIITPAQAIEIATRVHTNGAAHRERWSAHLANRLAYERAMLAESGGTAADKTGPEKGGACRCWASPGRYNGGWSYIQKVNKVSVTVLDNWGNGGANFTRTIPFDKLSAIMTAAEVEAAHRGSACGHRSAGFYLATHPHRNRANAKSRANRRKPSKPCASKLRLAWRSSPRRNCSSHRPT